MELALREELKIDCRSTGQLIQDTVLERNDKMSNDEIDNCFKPMINKIEERVEKQIKAEIEEDRCRQEDAEDEAEQEDALANKRANVSERSDYYINGKRMYFPRRYSANNDILKDWSKVTHYAKFLPTKDYDDLNDSDVEYDTDDSHFDEYVRRFQINIKEPYQDLFETNAKKLNDFCEKHTKTQNEIKKLLKDVPKYGICGYLQYNTYETTRLVDIICSKKRTHDLDTEDEPPAKKAKN